MQTKVVLSWLSYCQRLPRRLQACQLSSTSAVVEFVLVPRGEQHDIDVANREQDDAPAMAEGDDQFPELPARFRSTTGVWRK